MLFGCQLVSSEPSSHFPVTMMSLCHNAHSPRERRHWHSYALFHGYAPLLLLHVIEWSICTVPNLKEQGIEAKMTQRVLDWRNRRAWLQHIRSYAKPLLTPKLVAVLERRRPDCWSDVMDWLPNHDDLVPEFCDLMSSFYTHFKAFHGCRPESLSSYYDHGLRGQNADLIIRKFRQLFADLPPASLDQAIEKMKHRESNERGRTWLSGDDRQMVRDFGHYIINGSEYLLALAAKLGGGHYEEDYRLRLRTIGIPTVLEVDIPIELIPPAQKLEVAKMMLSEWGQLRTKRPLGISSSPCYVVRSDIPAECIRAHYHPARIRDFHHCIPTYVNTTVRCDHCPPASELA